MTEAPPPQAPRQPRHPPAGVGRWSPADLRLHLGEWHISNAVLLAAMEDAKRTDFTNPADAKAVVDAFLKKKLEPTFP